MALGRVGWEVGVDCTDAGEGFHAEFRDKAAHELVKVLVGKLLLMPDVPLMEIAAGWVGGCVVAMAFTT